VDSFENEGSRILSRPGGTLVFSSPPIRRAWQTAWLQLQTFSLTSYEGLGSMLTSRLPGSLLTTTLVERARTALPELIRSARQLDITPALAAALPLVGAGPGLTPSWDDLLIGLFCGLLTTSWSDDQHRFVEQFGDAMSLASARTTTVSRAYIRGTIDGAWPAWIEDVLAAIAAGDSIRSRTAAARALSVGHTSGVDMMLGVILGSAVWQESNEVDQVLAALSCCPAEGLPTGDEYSSRILPQPV
jgi:hypothetical protein